MIIEVKLNTAPDNIVLSHLSHCNSQFLPPLDTRVSLVEYAKKIVRNAIVFEAWVNDILIGMIAMYINETKIGYITNVSVYAEYSGKGIAKKLFYSLIDYARENYISCVKLEVNILNIPAINLYKNLGFEVIEVKNDQIIMLKKIIEK